MRQRDPLRGKLAFDAGLVPHKRMKIETRSGVKELTLTEKNGEIIGATVNMGVPRIFPPLSLADGEGETTIYPVSMGNPHGVCIVKDVKVLDLTTKGPKLAVNSHFPEGINVEFVEVAAPTACGCGYGNGEAARRWPAVPGPVPPWLRPIALGLPTGPLLLLCPGESCGWTGRRMDKCT